MKKQHKHILILSPFFPPNIGGVETHLDDLVKGLTKRGIRTSVITYQPLTTKLKGKTREESDNLFIRRINWFGYNWFHKLEKKPFLVMIYLLPGILFHSLGYCLFNKVSAIHAHGFIAGAAAAVIKTFSPGIKTVLSTHAIYDFASKPRLSAFIRLIIKKIDIVLAMSKDSYDDLVKAGVSREKISTYTHWVDLDNFRPGNKTVSRKKLKLPDKFTVLFAGRMIAIKGTDVVMRVAEKMNDISFVVVGDGPELTKIKNQKLPAVNKAEPKTKNLFFFGNQNQNKIPCFLTACDVLIVPSLYKEGFARITLEALSSGRPVIASSRGSLREIVEKNVGYLVEPKESEFEKAIIKMKKDKNLLAKMSKNARKLAEKKYSEKNIIQIIQAY